MNKIKNLILLLIPIFFITGCFSLKKEITIYSDGSAKYYQNVNSMAYKELTEDEIGLNLLEKKLKLANIKTKNIYTKLDKDNTRLIMDITLNDFKDIPKLNKIIMRSEEKLSDGKLEEIKILKKDNTDYNIVLKIHRLNPKEVESKSDSSTSYKKNENYEFILNAPKIKKVISTEPYTLNKNNLSFKMPTEKVMFHNKDIIIDSLISIK